MTTEPKANREYKNSVFTLLFGDIAQELYCAVTGKPYDPNAKVDMATLSDVLYRGHLNDLAFILNGKLVVLIEHQSSINANMPLRMLQYVSKIYEKYIDRTYGKNAVYKELMLKIPRPEFIVLYNGVKELPNGKDRQTLRLSNMFAEQRVENTMGGLELEVEVFNINKGRNPEMAARCPELDGYETFVQIIRDNENAGMTKEEAIQKAVFDCVDNNILKEFLQTYKWEVVNMLVKEWDFDLEKQVAVEEALEEGEKKKALKIAKSMKEKGFDINTIADVTDLTVVEILDI